MTAARSVLALVALGWAGAGLPAGQYCTALDGTSLQCGRENVRVEGLRAPGLREPGGEDARRRLQRRIQSGEVVIERKGRDRMGWTLGRVYVNGNRITQLDIDGVERRRKR